MDLNFMFDSQLSCWKASTEFRRNIIEIRLFSPELRPSKTKSDLARETMEKANCNWENFANAMVDSLLELYNDEWAEPDDGLPVLKKDEFLKRITHQTIDLCVEDEYVDTITMYFSDSGMFGNHGIQLFWTGDDDIDVSLAG